MTLVLNMLGGPGSGKSTLAFGVIAKLKSGPLKAEFAAEFAKELTYRRDWNTLADQGIVTREQDRRLRDLLGHATIIVHDTAIPLGLLYARGDFKQDWFTRRCWELYEGYTNFNVFVTRVKAYQSYGRIQTEDEARVLDDRIRKLFDGKIHLEVPGEEASVNKVVSAVTSYLEKVSSDW